MTIYWLLVLDALINICKIVGLLQAYRHRPGDYRHFTLVTGLQALVTILPSITVNYVKILPTFKCKPIVVTQDVQSLEYTHSFNCVILAWCYQLFTGHSVYTADRLQVYLGIKLILNFDFKHMWLFYRLVYFINLILTPFR